MNLCQDDRGACADGKQRHDFCGGKSLPRYQNETIGGLRVKYHGKLPIFYYLSSFRVIIFQQWFINDLILYDLMKYGQGKHRNRIKYLGNYDCSVRRVSNLS